MKAKFVLSKSKLLEQYQKIARHNYIISYSLKTNPIVGAVLETETDCFFSIHSIEELKHLKDMSRVWFLAHALTTESIEVLFDKGIRNFVVDNLVDLQILEEHMLKTMVQVNLLLRMKLRENTIFTGKYFVFGMDVKDVKESIMRLKNNPLIKKLGIHFHRKTQNVSEWHLVDELMDILDDGILAQIDFLNIGGGFPAKYKNISDEAIQSVFTQVSRLKDWLKNKNVEIMVEPGRYLAAPAVELHAAIQSIIENTLVVNCSIYNTAMDTIIVPIKLIVKNELSEGKKYTIKGCTPCSLDIFRYDCRLENPKLHDEIVFLNAGAYNFATDFCDLPKIETEVAK